MKLHLVRIETISLLMSFPKNIDICNHSNDLHGHKEFLPG